MAKMGSSCVESSEDDVEIRVRVHSMREDLIVVSYTTNKNKENSCVITYFCVPQYIVYLCFPICNIFVGRRLVCIQSCILSTWFDRSENKVRHTEAALHPLLLFLNLPGALMALPRGPSKCFKGGRPWIIPIISLKVQESVRKSIFSTYSKQHEQHG